MTTKTTSLSGRLHLAMTRVTPAATLAVLAGDHDSDVRAAVARHPSTPAATLAQLAEDRPVVVRRLVADHPSTTASTLALLATDSEWLVRVAVATHPATPASSLALLATDGEWGVRVAVADRPPLTPDLPADEEILAAVTAAIADAERRGENWCDALPDYCHGDPAHESDGQYITTLPDGRVVWLVEGDQFTRYRIA